MTIIKICGIAIVASFALCVIKIYKPDFSVPVGMAGALAMMSICLLLISPIVSDILEIMNYSGSSVYISSIIKALGIGIIAESTAALCRDNGSGAIASKVELAARLMIIALAIPIMRELIDTAAEVMK